MAFKAQVTITGKPARDMLAELQANAVAFVTAAGQIVQANQRTRAPKATGNLINSIATEVFVVDGKPFSVTGPTADYAGYVEWGTGVFATQPRTSTKDRWTYRSPNGQWYTTKGQRPQPFAEPGYQASLPQINALAKRLLTI